MSTIKVADKPTLDTVNTNVSSVVNKLPSSKIADKSTLDTVNSNVTYIKNNLPSGGGGGYALKCVETGSVAKGESKKLTSSTGGVLYIADDAGSTISHLFPSLTVDGQSVRSSIFTIKSYDGGTAEYSPSAYFNIYMVPFRNSIILATSGTYNSNLSYILYKYDAI